MNADSHPFVYVAGPYSDENPRVRERRFQQHAKAAAWLVKRGHMVYAPIVHCHSIAVAGEIGGGWSFWEHMDMPFLKLSHLMIVLPLQGWTESRGLFHEKEYALEHDIPIAFMVGDADSAEYQRITWSKSLRNQLKTMGHTPLGMLDADHPKIFEPNWPRCQICRCLIAFNKVPHDDDGNPIPTGFEYLCEDCDQTMTIRKNSDQ